MSAAVRQQPIALNLERGGRRVQVAGLTLARPTENVLT